MPRSQTDVLSRTAAKFATGAHLAAVVLGMLRQGIAPVDLGPEIGNNVNAWEAASDMGVKFDQEIPQPFRIRVCGRPANCCTLSDKNPDHICSSWRSRMCGGAGILAVLSCCFFVSTVSAVQEMIEFGSVTGQLQRIQNICGTGDAAVLDGAQGSAIVLSGLLTVTNPSSRGVVIIVRDFRVLTGTGTSLLHVDSVTPATLQVPAHQTLTLPVTVRVTIDDEASIATEISRFATVGDNSRVEEVTSARVSVSAGARIEWFPYIFERQFKFALGSNRDNHECDGSLECDHTDQLKSNQNAENRDHSSRTTIQPPVVADSVDNVSISTRITTSVPWAAAAFLRTQTDLPSVRVVLSEQATGDFAEITLVDYTVSNSAYDISTKQESNADFWVVLSISATQAENAHNMLLFAIDATNSPYRGRALLDLSVPNTKCSILRIGSAVLSQSQALPIELDDTRRRRLDKSATSTTGVVEFDFELAQLVGMSPQHLRTTASMANVSAGTVELATTIRYRNDSLASAVLALLWADDVHFLLARNSSVIGRNQSFSSLLINAGDQYNSTFSMRYPQAELVHFAQTYFDAEIKSVMAPTAVDSDDQWTVSLCRSAQFFEGYCQPGHRRFKDLQQGGGASNLSEPSIG